MGLQNSGPFRANELLMGKIGYPENKSEAKLPELIVRFKLITQTSVASGSITCSHQLAPNTILILLCQLSLTQFDVEIDTSQIFWFEYRCVARLFKRDVANNSLLMPPSHLHILVGTKPLGFEDSDVSVGVGPI